VVAALLRAGQPEVLAQRVEHRRARIELERVLDPADREADGNGRIGDGGAGKGGRVE